MQGELQIDAAAARALLRSQADDQALHPKIRQDAAKALLAMAGYVAPKANAQDKAPASLADMTGEQLRAILNEAEGELAKRSAPVNAQVTGSTDSEAVDLL